MSDAMTEQHPIDESTPVTGEGTSPDQDAVIAAIATVYDPEIPVNIYELGLIYAIDLHDDGRVNVEMTLTAPNCPSAQELPEMVRDAILNGPNGTNDNRDIVGDTPLAMSRNSDDATLDVSRDRAEGPKVWLDH